MNNIAFSCLHQVKKPKRTKGQSTADEARPLAPEINSRSDYSICKNCRKKSAFKKTSGGNTLMKLMRMGRRFGKTETEKKMRRAE